MDANIRSKSILLSVGIHALIFLILLFTYLKTAIPPFPEAGGGGGVIVNIGTVDEASGEIQPMAETVTKDPNVERVKPTPTTDDNVATQENEATHTIKVSPIKKPTVVKPQVIQVKKPEPPRKSDPGALYQGKTTASKSQGTGHGTGDQGDPQGDPNSKYTGKNGLGGTGNGTGPGDGAGDGPGKGSGSGKGFSFTLAGRQMVRAPQVSDHSQETGKVVVDITVDKTGTVVSAAPGGRGSTTTSSYLFRLAKEAAMKAKFTANPDAADIQKGTMTFVFLVQ